LATRRYGAMSPMAIEEGPHHSPTLRRFEIGQRVVRVLYGKEPENEGVSLKRVDGGVLVLECIQVRVDLLPDWGVTPALAWALVPSSLDNGQRAPRKLLRAVVAPLLGRRPSENQKSRETSGRC
jgi:hypothetical protein